MSYNRGRLFSFYKINYGGVTNDKGHVRISWAFSRDLYGAPSSDFILVPWGGRHYLIETGEILDFFSSIRRGDEPRKTETGMALLRSGDEMLNVRGEPELPPEFEKYRTLIKIDAKVIAMGEPFVPPIDHGSAELLEGLRMRFVTFNVGKADGVMLGMSFWLVRPLPMSGYGDVARIVNVLEYESVGLIRIFDEGYPDISSEYVTPLH